MGLRVTPLWSKKNSMKAPRWGSMTSVFGQHRCRVLFAYYLTSIAYSWWWVLGSFEERPQSQAFSATNSIEVVNPPFEGYPYRILFLVRNRFIRSAPFGFLLRQRRAVMRFIKELGDLIGPGGAQRFRQMPPSCGLAGLPAWRPWCLRRVLPWPGRSRDRSAVLGRIARVPSTRTECKKFWMLIPNFSSSSAS